MVTVAFNRVLLLEVRRVSVGREFSWFHLFWIYNNYRDQRLTLHTIGLSVRSVECCHFNIDIFCVYLVMFLP